MGIRKALLHKGVLRIKGKKGNRRFSIQEVKQRKRSCWMWFYLLICSTFYSHKLLIQLFSWRLAYQAASPNECRQGTHCDMCWSEHASTNSDRTFFPQFQVRSKAPLGKKMGDCIPSESTLSSPSLATRHQGTMHLESHPSAEKNSQWKSISLSCSFWHIHITSTP